MQYKIYEKQEKNVVSCDGCAFYGYSHKKPLQLRQPLFFLSHPAFQNIQILL